MAGMLMDVFALTAHDLDVIRTIFAGLGALGGFAAGVAAVAGLAARKFAKQAADQTATSEHVNGKVRTVSTATVARHTMMTGEATRQEVADLGQWLRGPGRRRLDTTDVPRLPPDESTYS